MHSYSRGKFARATISLIVLGFIPGCIGGSLATDTGPGGAWSTDQRQMVYVGEHVEFSFTLCKGADRQPCSAFGIADYCIAGAGPERIQADPDDSGRYRFDYDVTQLRPGAQVTVTATAHRENGVRDIRQIGEEWIVAEDPFDMRDDQVASSSVTLTVYRTVVELPLRDAPDNLDLSTGRLEIVKTDGNKAVIAPATPDRDGYTVGPPDRSGLRQVLYDPQARQINKAGRTLVRFIAFDSAGAEHVFEGYIPTP